MSCELLPARLTTRPAGPEDESFLFTLFASTQADQFPGGAAQRELLLRLQFRGQQMTYASQYPGSDHSIILLDGQPVGRLWLARGTAEHRVVDIALQREYQSAGIGTYFLRRAMSEAATEGVPLRLSVLQANPRARELYGRLGFTVMDQDALRVRMEWVSV